MTFMKRTVPSFLRRDLFFTSGIREQRKKEKTKNFLDRTIVICKNSSKCISVNLINTFNIVSKSFVNSMVIKPKTSENKFQQY